MITIDASLHNRVYQTSFSDMPMITMVVDRLIGLYYDVTKSSVCAALKIIKIVRSKCSQVPVGRGVSGMGPINTTTSSPSYQHTRC